MLASRCHFLLLFVHRGFLPSTTTRTAETGDGKHVGTRPDTKLRSFTIPQNFGKPLSVTTGENRHLEKFSPKRVCSRSLHSYLRGTDVFLNDVVAAVTLERPLVRVTKDYGDPRNA